MIRGFGAGAGDHVLSKCGQAGKRRAKIPTALPRKAEPGGET